MNNYDFPVGSDNQDAPWNDKLELKPIKTKVTVSVTLSKEMEIELTDYNIDILDQKEGIYEPDITQDDLEKAVLNQKVLPQDAYSYAIEGAREDLSNWSVDDFQVIM